MSDIQRTEKLHFLLCLDKTKTDTHHKDVKRILGGRPVPEVTEGDTLKVTYDLSIEYWGDVVTRLEAISRVLDDPDVVISVSTEELEHGSCLIEDVFSQIKAVQQQIEARK